MRLDAKDRKLEMKGRSVAASRTVVKPRQRGYLVLQTIRGTKVQYGQQLSWWIVKVVWQTVVFPECGEIGLRAIQTRERTLASLVMACWVWSPWLALLDLERHLFHLGRAIQSAIVVKQL